MLNLGIADSIRSVTKVDAVATEPHYLDHMLPVWRALPDHLRGTFYLSRRLMFRMPEAELLQSRLPKGDGLVLVAGFADLKRTAGRHAILMEHGCGQSYGGAHPAYAGGTGRHNVVGFLLPNQQSAARCRVAYPDRRVEVIGSPRLAHLQGIPERRTSNRTTVAFSFHWDNPELPETRSAWGHFLPGVEMMARDPKYRVIGHGHPKLFADIEPVYRKMGVETASSFEEVVERADVFVCDNSSTLFEFAYVRGPVVVMNPPWYRTDVNHGLRFWEAADVGPQVWDPGSIPGAVELALREPWPGKEAALSVAFDAVEDPAARAAQIIGELSGQDHSAVPERAHVPFPRVSTSLR